MRRALGWRLVAVVVAVAAGWPGAALGQQTLAYSRYNQQDPDWPAELRLLREHFGLDRDQSATVNMLLSGALSEQRMQRRVYDRRRSVWENEEESEKTKATAAAENQRFADRRLQIEKTWLSELRDIVLTPQQLSLWESYERARRVKELLLSQGMGELVIEALVRDVELSASERSALAEPIERQMHALDELATKYLAANANWLAIRWGKAKGDADKVEADRDKTLAGLMDVLRQGLRSACDAMPVEKAATVRAVFEVRSSESELGLSRLEQEEFVGDYTRISTLTEDQQARIKAVLAKGDSRIIKLVRTFSEKRPAVRNDRAAYYKLRNEYARDRSRATLDVVKQVREVLTEDQRRAYDEGREPPIDSAEFHRRFGDDDEYYRNAWESED